MTVTRAVIPAAGRGTRFLPATKAIPKEMLPVIDRPVIEYAVAEAVDAGITEVVIVVNDEKEAIERHFTAAPGLEKALEDAGKTELLERVRRSTEMATIGYIVQAEQLGLGHAVATAAPLLGDQPFAVLLPDEVITSGLLATLLGVFDERDASVIGLMHVDGPEISSYGVPEAEDVDAGLVRVLSMVEKPAHEDAPSAYATIGRYVFTPEILEALDGIKPGVGGELQLTDAIDALAKNQAVFGAVLESGRWDVGQVHGMLRAALELALDRPDLRDPVRAMLSEIARDHGLG